MARADKVEAVAEIVEHLRSSNATVLTDYRGLTVAQLKTLRRNLGEGAHYAVVKNTLTKIAAKDAGIDGLTDLLVGPSALAFIKGDPVEAAKNLRDFAKANPLLVIKGGVMDGKPLSAAEITKLADLESREVLLAKLAGAMKAKTSQAAALFQAPLAKAVRTIEALRAKAEADPSVIAGLGTAPPEPDTAASGGEPVAAGTADPGAGSETLSSAETDSTENTAEASQKPAEAPEDTATGSSESTQADESTEETATGSSESTPADESTEETATGSSESTPADESTQNTTTGSSESTPADETTEG